MTYRDAVALMPEDDRFRATLYALTTILKNKGVYTEYEFDKHFTHWAKTAYRECGGKMEFLVATTAEFYGVHPSQLRCHSKLPHLVLARQVSIYLCRALTDFSYTQIGKFFSKHHTTVMHSEEMIAERRKFDEKLNAFIKRASDGYVEQWGDTDEITAQVEARL
jgi:chromosomal replication initiation ATPase DnaA